MSRSTMCELLHKSAVELKPLHTAALACVKSSPDVHWVLVAPLLRATDETGKA